MDAIKARYYFHYKKYDTALTLAEKSQGGQPLFTLSRKFYKVKFMPKKENAKREFAKVAFENLPRNASHASQFINLSMKLGKAEAIEVAFLYLPTQMNLIIENATCCRRQLFPPAWTLVGKSSEQAGKN